MRWLLTSLFVVLLAFSANAQSFLNDYIKRALDSNISLQQKELSYEKSLAALQEAKALFFPKISIEARYSLARGGRSIEFPIGDLLNPVYNNLNLINGLNEVTTPDYPSIADYPKVDNQQFTFLRETDQETKVRLAMPIYNAAILKNRNIKQDLVGIEKVSVDIYKRELVNEVKKGYFNFLKATQALQLFEQTLLLVEENQRTSQSLYKNHKVTIDVVYAAEAEVKKVEQQKAEAEKNKFTAQAFFNFLLNRNYSEAIEEEELMVEPSVVLSVDAARNTAVQNREELNQLNQYLSLADKKISLERSTNLPQVNLVADYGFQGETYAFGKDDDFVMGSVVLSWNLFDRSKRARVEQAKIDRQMLEQQKAATQQQIGLNVVNTFYDLRAAEKSIDFAAKEVESTQKAYKLVAKKFTQGQTNLVSLTNARTQQTNAALKKIIAQYDLKIKQAALERALGTYKF